MRAVADRLDRLDLDYAFVGGSIVNLLLDYPALSPARPTDDVDVIIETATSRRYSAVEDALRRSGFSHDMGTNAPLCRWLLGNVAVDIMPSDGAFLGLNTAWFSEALATATEQVFDGVRLRLISPVAFIATKYVAFTDRGAGDYHASHDLEDLVTVVDGRAGIVREVRAAPTSLREYVSGAVRTLVASPSFNDSLPGHLPSDRANQQRVPGLRRKFQDISTLI